MTLGLTGTAQLMAREGNENGVFLVRESSKKKGDYVLSVYQGKVQHFVITVAPGTFSIDDGCAPPSRLGPLAH